MLLETSAGTITFSLKTGKILMIETKTSSGKIFWSYPKGHIESGENLKQTAIRETFEETGIKVNIIRKVFDKEVYRLYNNVKFHRRIVLFAAVTNDNESNIKPQFEEVVDARFVSLENALFELKKHDVEFILPTLKAFNIISKMYPYLFEIK